MSRLTDAERGTITRATELADLRGTEAVTARFGGWGDDTVANYASYVEAFGLARLVITDLIAIINRLDGENS